MIVDIELLAAVDAACFGIVAIVLMWAAICIRRSQNGHR